MEKLQIVILGRNYTSLLGMIRAVAEIDCEITVIRSIKKIPKKNSIKSFLKKIIMGKPIESTSKYVKNFLYTIEPNSEYLVKLLLDTFQDINQKVIIIPTDDYTASTIDLYQDQLKDKFLFPNVENQPGKIIELMDKQFQKKLAEKNKLSIAQSWIINKKNNEFVIPKDIVYPVFLKPLISFKGNKTIMKKCENKKELLTNLNSIPKNIDCSILAEQYINIEKEYAILGCSYNKKVIMPAIIEMLKSGSGSHKGVTLKGKVQHFDNKKYSQYKNLEKFISSLNFNGLFDIDLYESNGVVYFNELNLRFGASGYAITKSGVNLPKIFILNLLNKQIPNLNNVQENIFLNEKVNLEEYEANFINFKQYKANIKNNDIYFVKSQNDIKPYKNFQKMERYIRLKKLFKVLKNG